MTTATPTAGDADDTWPAGAASIARSTRDSRFGLAGFALIVAALVTLPFWDGDNSLRTQLTVILYYLALAQLWNLLAGYAGMISIGQQMFVGVGVYTTMVLAEDVGIDPFLSIPLAGVVAAVIAVPAGLVAFRLHGGYFAIGTWVLAEVVRLVVLEVGPLEAGNVRSLTRESLGAYEANTRNDIIYWCALALAVGTTALVVLILRSRLGLALQAVRDNEAGAEGLGVDLTRTKFIVWIITAFWTGMVGAVIVLNVTAIRADAAFSVLRWTALVLFIVIIGGVGSPTGPIFGVLVFWFLDEQLADADSWRFIILGLIAAVMAVVAPGGINSLVQRVRPTELFPVKRQLVFDNASPPPSTSESSPS
ncbi:MAG: branched-chain amino acid ABC transporter permease [Actinomycetota bacterium]